MVLHIDTVEYGKITFGLSKSPSELISVSKSSSQNKRRITSQSFPVKPQESDKILEILEKFLKKSEIRNPKSEIKKIVIYKGQGSFTGLRVGAAIADALSLAWGIPAKVKIKK